MDSKIPRFDHEHFHGLTPAEAERLYVLSEEAAEVVMACQKILRHGPHSHHPQAITRNIQDLEKEVGHVLNAINMMVDAGDMAEERIECHKDHKRETIGYYLHHQEVNNG